LKSNKNNNDNNDNNDDKRTEIMQQIKVSRGDKRTMKQCFQLFDIIHGLTSDLSVMSRVMDEVLHDFRMNDNCRYIELRSTPREMIESGTNARDYVNVLLNRMERFQQEGLSTTTDISKSLSENDREEQSKAMTTTTATTTTTTTQSKHYSYVDAQLLLSVNRAHSFEKAEETVKLAIEYYGRGVCGIDFSGNCFTANFKKFEPLFEYARTHHKIPSTIHFAECSNFEDSFDILKFKPERLGHAAVLNDELERELIKSKIPIEVCLTSNILCKLHDSYNVHPFRKFYQASHPMAICTDDMGVFDTTLCKEYSLLAHSDYTQDMLGNAHTEQELKQRLFDISRNTIEHCFCSESVKQELRGEFDRFALAHCL